MTRKTKIGASIAALFAVFVFGFIAYKGTFNTVTYIERDNVSYLLYGKEYNGPIRDQAWMDLFKEMEKAAAIDSSLKLVAYYENEPTEKNDYSVKAFVGVSLFDGSERLKEVIRYDEFQNSSIYSEGGMAPSIVTGLEQNTIGKNEYRKIHFEKSISASKHASPFFQRLFSDATKYCMEKGYLIDQDILLEIYHSDEFMEVVAPYTMPEKK